MAEKPDQETRAFSPHTRFQAMARRPGGITRGQAIENAQAKIEDIKPGFDRWLDGELNALSNAVEGLKSGEAKAEWIDSAQFHCNQLRDVGTTMGFELLTFVSNTLCMILDGIKAGAECNIDSIACHMDALLLVRQQPYRNLRPDQMPELVDGLHRVAESVSIVPNNGQK
jgi:hypothetical protein